ncbi:transglycosylase SLT domain-containing protein [Pendulispora rubella]|uniref:Transglycosylase SLT domain-containing protein n=1 Tax=Pendulispora rubella TaxID=2741070 RepID=A0ABZ2KVN5_9BACT
MRKPAFYALVGVIGALPLVGAGIALTRPSVRAALRGFVSPVAMDAGTLARPDGGGGGLTTLPSIGAAAGAESIELRAVVQGISPDGGAPIPPKAQPPRKASLFEGAAPGDSKKLPKGLKRSDLTSRDDVNVDNAMASLVQNDGTRRTLTDRVQRTGRYRDDITRILRAWKVPESLLVLAVTDGGFSPTEATGDAVGIWKLTPDVATAYGLALLEKYDERRSVAISTEATAHYLADLRERFGSWELALYAYGIGYRTAVSDIAAHSVTDFWTSFDVLTPDGKDYVIQVLATAQVLGNLPRFGLDRMKLDDPIRTSDLEVPGGAPLSVVARAANTSLDRIRELNPEYLSDTVPSTKFAMVVHLPTEGLARAKEVLMPLLYSTNSGVEGRAGSAFDWGKRNLPNVDAGSTETTAAARPINDGVAVGSGSERRVLYRAREGDTLEGLARAYGVSPVTIVTDNALDPAAPLKAGALLTIRAPEDAGAPDPTPAAPSKSTKKKK